MPTEGTGQMQDPQVEEILPELKMMISNEEEEDNTPQVKIPPPIFKGLPGEQPDTHLLAAQDWMEVMLFRVDDYTDKFKHTLQHLAREWYHGLDMDQFGSNWCEFT